MLRDGEAWRLVLGEAVAEMSALPDGCVDMVCADPPYGTTACEWDSVVPLEPLWEQLKRVLKPRAAVVLTASQPFTTALIVSNRAWFKYCLVWDKKKPSGGLNADVMPMKVHEDIVVFGRRAVYNPQMRGVPRKKCPPRLTPNGEIRRDKSSVMRGFDNDGLAYPTSIIDISNADQSKERYHPTQKPVPLMAYLVRTYTNEGAVVLDPYMGSGTTGVACLQTGRRFVGIEIDPAYHAIAAKRLTEAANAAPLFDSVPAQGQLFGPP